MEKLKKQSARGRSTIITGAVILLIGLLWLLSELGVHLPHWVFSWETLLIGIGVVLGLDNKFRNPASYILIAIGAIFLIDDWVNIPVNVMEYFWPALLMIIGAVILLRPQRRKKTEDPAGEESPGTAMDRLDLVSIFNGTERTVISKNFKGGDAVTVFGGTEINLLHADIDGEARLDIVTIFGGTKILVPKNWEVRNEVSGIFGGVEDKRYSAVEIVTDDNKVLTVTGTAIFGGVEIGSF